DLALGPVVRGRLVRMGAESHVLMVTFHHIVADGWSLGVFLEEGQALYAAAGAGRSAGPTPVPGPYGDYAGWPRGWDGGEQLAAQGAYWQTALADAPAVLTLPTDAVRPPAQSYAGAMVPVALDAALTEGLRALARQQDATVFMTVLAGWAALLTRLSGQV